MAILTDEERALAQERGREFDLSTAARVSTEALRSLG